MNDNKIKLAASMACADFKNLEDEIKELEDAGIDLFHFDICDGYFAPTFLFSPIIIKSLRQLTKIRFDVHLYCNYPSRYINEIADSGADFVIVHIEAEENYKEAVKKILGFGLKAGIAILPGSKIPEDISTILPYISVIITNTVGPAYAGQSFNYEGLTNTRKFSKIVKSNNYNPDIAVDGGINEKTIEAGAESGANVFILGSTGLFSRKKDYYNRVKLLKDKIDAMPDFNNS